MDREDGAREIDGTPAVHDAGQGGLLDVVLHPEFPDERWLYLTYAATTDANGDESTTHLGRGRLEPEAATLEEFEVLYAAEPFVGSNAHYGSRVVFGPEDRLYVTVGDRQFDEFGPDHVSQDPTNDLGTTLRLEADGSIPEENPFVDDEGRRGLQLRPPERPGMTVHPEAGEIWQSEHGEEDGDEINVLEAGGNYGWPVAGYDCEYGTDEPVGDDPREREDVVDPVYYWECNTGGFPPAGATFYDGEAFPDWQGDLFVGNLAGEYLGRFAVDGRDVEELEALLADRGWRIRDVAVAPIQSLSTSRSTTATRRSFGSFHRKPTSDTRARVATSLEEGGRVVDGSARSSDKNDHKTFSYRGVDSVGMSTQEQSGAAASSGTRSPDAVVVGAGTAGCYAAATVAREGYDVVVLERKSEEKRATSPAGTP